MTLLDQDWTETHAQGLLDSLNLDGGPPKWKPEHLWRLLEWCSAHGEDGATVDGQLGFVAYELCNGFQAVGMALKRAKTVEEAREIIKPYVRRLSAGASELGRTAERHQQVSQKREESEPSSARFRDLGCDLGTQGEVWPGES